MSIGGDYSSYDALGLAELVRSGKASAPELLECAIQRAEQVNPRINAIVRPLYERARERAKQPLSGPLAGVPFLLKDLIQTIAGVETGSGTDFYTGYVPKEDSELFRRYEEAGLNTFGKTNVPEFGLLPVTEPKCGKPTRNPWDLGRTCGGSSGGAASAVASGIVPMAHGGDGGGSIRIPAACAGLFGLKPTRGRTPLGPYSEHWCGFAIEHVLTRSVRDSAAALDAVDGVEAHVPYHPPMKHGLYLDAASEDPAPLRIAFSNEPSMPSDVHPDCEAAVHDAVKLLEDLGHRVDEVRPEYDARQLARWFVIIVGANTAASLREAEALMGKKITHRDFETTTMLSAMLGDAFSASEVMEAIRGLQAETRRHTARMERYDVVLTPTLGQPPIRIGELEPPLFERKAQELIVRTGAKRLLRADALMEQTIDRVFQFTAFTPHANYTGQPSMSVPLFWNSEGLPVGTQFTARFGDEATLFRLAGQLERARPWKDKRPSL
jgi:amidase